MLISRKDGVDMEPCYRALTCHLIISFLCKNREIRWLVFSIPLCLSEFCLTLQYSVTEVDKMGYMVSTPINLVLENFKEIKILSHNLSVEAKIRKKRKPHYSPILLTPVP